MRHHRSRVSRSPQPAIDSLPSISDLSLNLICPPTHTSQERGFVSVCICVFVIVSAGPTEYACVLLMVCGGVPRLTLVNRVANWDFVTIFVVPQQPVVSLSLYRQHNDKVSSTSTAWML